MNKYESKNRSEIAAYDKWNIEAMYPDESKWDDDLTSALTESQEFSSLRGTITSSASHLLNALDLYADIMRKAENAFVYSRMRHDEDNANSKYTEMNSKSLSVVAQISANLSFFTPELLETDKETIDRFGTGRGILIIHTYNKARSYYRVITDIIIFTTGKRQKGA